MTKCHKVSVKALEKLSGGWWWWWHSDYNLCSWSRRESFSEILRDSLRFFEIWYGMDLDRSLTILRVTKFSETCLAIFPSCCYLLTYNEPLFSALLSIFYRGHIGPGSGAAKNCSTPKLFMIITFAPRTKSVGLSQSETRTRYFRPIRECEADLSSIFGRGE